MNVIVFASRKGGSGKSTLAAHLAAHVHKATKPILLVDADPQGSLTLWHKLRGTNEPPIKTAVNSVSGIVAAAKRDGIEWVLIDTPPNLSAVVDDAIRNATMVIIPARPGVFDVNAVQETIQTCRSARKPYAVVVNGAPAERDGVESRIVTIAREALAKFRAPVWSGQITNRADLLMALSQAKAPANIMPKAALRRRSPGCGPRSNVRSRRSAERRRHRAPCTSRRRNNAAFFSGLFFGLTKTRGAPRVFLLRVSDGT